MLSLLLQASLLAHPLYLEEEPPELRASRHVLLLYGDSELARHDRSVEDTHELADELVLRLRAGERFEDIVQRYSDSPSAQRDLGVLGSFGPGMLAPSLDAFLFEAEVGDISEPLTVGGGIEILQRIEGRAAVLQILAAGDDAEAKIAGVRKRLDAGEDFGKLASELSDDEASRLRAGQFAIYERGPRDRLLKAAAFDAELGEVVGPIRTSYGLHLLKRVPLDAVDASLAENNWVRVRAILVQHELAEGADPATAPTLHDAKHVVDAIERRLKDGEDMGLVAMELNDDPGGRKREGDLGWVYRRAPRIQRVLGHAFRARIGEWNGPHQTPLGWVFLLRER